MFGFESVVILVVGIFLVKSLLSYIRVGLRRRSLARRFGCKPVKTYKQYDKFLGLFFLYQNIRNYPFIHPSVTTKPPTDPINLQKNAFSTITPPPPKERYT